MINEDKYIQFIIDNKLTQKQFLLLHLVHRKRYDLLKKYEEAFPTGDGTIIGRQDTNDLLERGFIKYYKDGAGTHLVLCDKVKSAYVNEAFLTEEIYDTYPSFYDGEDGVRYPLTAYDRMAFGRIYMDKIYYSQKEHEEILKDIEFGKEHNLIKIKISNFLTSEYWKTLRELRLKDTNNNNTIQEEHDYS